MKNLRLFFLSCFTLVSGAIFSQISDIGNDWNTSKDDPEKLVAAISGVSFIEEQLSYIINTGMDYQMNIEIGGSGLSRAASHNAVYISNSSYPSSTAYSYLQLGSAINSAYVEGFIASEKMFSTLKLNGATASTSNPTEAALLFCDVTPFDISRVTAYTNVYFPACRAGGDGATFDETVIPEGTKSFRVYGRAQLAPSSIENYYEVKNSETVGEETITPEGAFIVGTGVSSARIAYINATIVPSTTSLKNIENANKVIVNKTYYNLSGCPISTPIEKGMVIQKTQYEDGTNSYDKIYIDSSL